jgi:hypothetical protein
MAGFSLRDPLPGRVARVSDELTFGLLEITDRQWYCHLIDDKLVTQGLREIQDGTRFGAE